MFRAARLLIAVLLLGTLAFGSVASTAAGGHKLLDATMAGIPSRGLPLHGLIGVGAPWVIGEGRAKLDSDGRLDLRVEGLLLLNGTNPIAMGRAVVTCSSVAVASSQDVPFSPAGDARVRATLVLPATCLAPAVFFVNADGGKWIAVTGQ